jgi:hypothetical protein
LHRFPLPLCKERLQGAIVTQDELLPILLLGKKFPEKPISPDWWDDVDCEAVQISRFQHGEPEEAPAYLLRLIHWLTILYRYVLDRPQGCLCRGCFDAVLDKLAGIWLLPPDAVGRLALARTMDNIIERKMVDVREGGGVAGEILCCADGHKAETISLNAEGRSYLRNDNIIMNWDYIQRSMFFHPIQPVKRRYMLDEIEEQLNGNKPIDIPLTLLNFRAHTASILRDLGNIRTYPHFPKVKGTFRSVAGYFLAFPETVSIGIAATAFADEGTLDAISKLLKAIDDVIDGWPSEDATPDKSAPPSASAATVNVNLSKMDELIATLKANSGATMPPSPAAPTAEPAASGAVQAGGMEAEAVKEPKGVKPVTTQAQRAVWYGVSEKTIRNWDTEATPFPPGYDKNDDARTHERKGKLYKADLKDRKEARLQNRFDARDFDRQN